MEIVLYALSVMYSPGPVNALGLNAGLRGQARRALGFYAGVGCAMLLLFLVLGYAGTVLVSGALLPWLALLGGGYCLYLGYLIARAAPPTAAGEEEGAATRLTFARGFLIQGLNPKGWLAVLPIATVMFPAAQVTGGKIALWSLPLALSAGGAPASYALLGALLGRYLVQGRGLRGVNLLLGLSLVGCALLLFHDAWRGLLG
ncbi:threonine/homoserine/homoserine lactone efflux protein [Pseudomonas oryzihabitans]|uniref:LysE family transporter n=1 Tax=Pseudomonas flavocrustae TaxID=2991719 RepID=A0ABT6IM96_9PSED|nr:LysE family transporter [Pseudomonas sp. CBMAI 2609]MDH4764985.1 LysE family transporter [Pseudomonas sp. CBMAI 2609]